MMTNLPWFLPIPLLLLPMASSGNGIVSIITAIIFATVVCYIIWFGEAGSSSSLQTCWKQIQNEWKKLKFRADHDLQLRKLLYITSVALCLLLVLFPPIGVIGILLASCYIAGKKHFNKH